MLFRSPIKATLALVAAASLVASAQSDCLSDSLAVQGDEGLVNATTALIDGQLNLKPPATCGTSGDTLSCSYDFGTASDNYKNTCEAAGGQVVTSDFSITCKVTVDGSSTGVTYLFTKAPECLATSCDKAAYDAKLKNVTGELAKKMEADPLLSDCKSETSAAGPAMSALLVVTGAVLSSMMLMF